MEWKLPKWGSYRFLGPTTIHLQHEFYLLISLTMSTISSLHAVHGESFGTWGDIQFLFFVSLWLSRYLLLRWMCTWDVSTTRSPTLKGLVVFWWTCHVSAGQYFDRPNPHVIAKHIGSSHTDDGHTMATLASFVSPSIRHIWHWFRVRVWFTMSAIQDQLLGTSGGRYSIQDLFPTTRPPSSSSSQVGWGINKAYSYWSDFWSLYGLSLQAMLPVAILAMYASHFFGEFEIIPFFMNMIHWDPDEDMREMRPFGAYRKLEKPSMGHMLMLLSIGGTLGSILLYGRVVLPFPDLVAGSNVLKAVRNETKSSVAPSTKPTKSKSQRENVDVPWAEQYKSIVVENKFRLICKVALVRVLEGIFICTILPRMGSTCRYTGHCQEGLSFKELARILYPIGITTPLRTDSFYKSESSFAMADVGAVVLTVISVLVSTVSILLAQATTLNRSYLGTMGYIAGGWAVVDPSDPCLVGASPTAWDPRRRYKKEDLIVQNVFRKPIIYKATSNLPEGRPLDVCLRATHALFRDEFGHPATSTVIACGSAAQLAMVMTTMVAILGCMILGYGYGGLFWTLGANLIGSYGILWTVRPQYRELEDLAKQITADNHYT